MSTPSPANIAAHLPARAAERPQTLAIVQPRGRDRLGRFRYRHFTFRELDAETDRLAAGLERVGIGRGVRTVLMTPPSLEFYALTFALFKAGAVVVLIDPGMGVKNLAVCLREAEPEAFIGVPEAHLARTVLGWARHSIRNCVTVGMRLGWRGRTLDQVRELGARQPFPMHQPAAGRDGRRAVHQRQHRRRQGRRLHPRHFRRPGGPAPPPLRHPARRGRSADFSALRTIWTGTGHDGRHPADGPDQAGPRRCPEDRRGDPGVRRDEPVRLAGPGPARRPLRRDARRQAAVAAARDLGRGAGAGVGPGALPVAAGRRRAGVHALRRHGGVAGLLDRQRRDPGRDARPDGGGRRRLRRPAGGRRKRPRHPHQRRADCRLDRRSGSRRAARSARSSCEGRW